MFVTSYTTPRPRSGCTRAADAFRSGSFSKDSFVKFRSALTVRPYISTADVDIRAPGGSSMNGMNLSGNPGIVHPMQTPPTFGHPPMPFIHPRFGTLQTTTGPQQPIFTMQRGD